MRKCHEKACSFGRIFVCFSLSLAFFVGFLFIDWSLKKDYVFDLHRTITLAKISLIGIPIGVVLWFFEIRQRL